MLTRTTKFIRLGSITLVGILGLSLGTHAFAQSSGNVNVSLPGVSIKASNSGNVDMNVGGMQIKASNSGANIQVPGHASINATQNGAQIQAQDGGNTVNVNANNGGATITVFGPPTSVETSEQLTSYVAEAKHNNPAITDVQATPQQLTVSYVQPATLFGVIPLSLNAQLTVQSNNGDVSVQLPWYSFLTTNNSAAVAASVKQDTHVSTMASSNTSGAQAWVVYDVSNSISAS